MHEVAIMRSLKHERVLSVLSAWMQDEHMWLVTPYCKGGSVADILKVCTRPDTQHNDRTRLVCILPPSSVLMSFAADARQARHPRGLTSEPAIATIAAAVLDGLAYVHREGYMHRDVKVMIVHPESDVLHCTTHLQTVTDHRSYHSSTAAMPAQAANILVGEDGQVRLADFGVACALLDDGDVPTLHGLQMKPRPAARSTPIGTPVFMAPEVSCCQLGPTAAISCN